MKRLKNTIFKFINSLKIHFSGLSINFFLTLTRSNKRQAGAEVNRLHQGIKTIVKNIQKQKCSMLVLVK